MALATGAGKETTAVERVKDRLQRDSGRQQTVGCGDLCERLARIIDQRTAGRVHALRVTQCTDTGCVQVHGVVGSHYVRQLVLAAVLEALGQEGLRLVRLDVHVRRASHG